MTNSFSNLGLSEGLVKSLDNAGFTTPTPIQAQAIPPQLQGRDILGIAQTGSGKTAAFSLPIIAGLAKMEGRIEPRSARALILAPTRELAVQIEEVIRTLSGSMRISTVLVLGGVSRYHQVQKLAKGVDVVIATPGRLKDLIADKKVRLDHTRWLVLDEADRMLDMGFIKPVREIAALIGSRRQTALFSATMAPEIAQLAAGLLKDPVRVEATPPATAVVAIEQRVILTSVAGKRSKLNELLGDADLRKVLVFTRTKHGADRVAKNLNIDGHKVAAIHGNKSQNARQAALKGFTEGKVRVLVATDIAARGIDVPDISHVINFELPDEAENYVHRIGRTGRNGATGIAVTLCDGTERGKLRDVERLIRRTLPSTGEFAAGEFEKKGGKGGTSQNRGSPGRGAAQRPGEAKPRSGDGRPQRTRSAPANAPRGEAPAWWEKAAGSGAKAAAGKAGPRGGRGQRAGGARRGGESRARVSG